MNNGYHIETWRSYEPRAWERGAEAYNDAISDSEPEQTIQQSRHVVDLVIAAQERDEFVVQTRVNGPNGLHLVYQRDLDGTLTVRDVPGGE